MLAVACIPTPPVCSISALTFSLYFAGISPLAKKINSVESYLRIAPHFTP